MMTSVTRSALGLLFVAAVLFQTGSAQAVPVNHPDKCPDQMPEGSFSCLSGGGKLLCTNDGDVMCCKPNAQGGQDCEQIMAFKGPKGSIRVPGGVLQNAPMTVQPNPPRVPKAGMNAPIMRRGVEADSAPASPTVPEDQGK
jgi:hypothetical protein